jgi:hypothetical protein
VAALVVAAAKGHVLVLEALDPLGDGGRQLAALRRELVVGLIPRAFTTRMS